ncbi:MAG: YraN family protein [Clostridia bacterium]
MLNKRLMGAEGEHKSTIYLKKQHYKILKTNYFSKIGEIDIIAKDKDILVFVEVKSRADDSFGMPAEAVTKRKQHMIIGSAKLYCIEKGIVNTQIRFDVIEILEGKINHIIDAFRC